MFKTLVVLFLLIAQCCAQQVPADYPTRVPGSCSSTQFFDCGNGQCIPFTNVRNCVNDCPDGSDELCGDNQQICDQNLPGDTGCGSCYSPGDNVAQICRDQRWVNLCTEPNTWSCSNTPNCVYIEWLQDGTNDCADWSDENPCLSGRSSTCSANAACAFNAATQATACTCNSGFEGNGQTCTAVVNPQTTPTPAATTTTAGSATDTCSLRGQFRCRNGVGCVEDIKVMDGIFDCADQSDENSCAVVTVLNACAAPPSALQCAYSAYNHTFNCGCADLTEPNNKRYCKPLADLPHDCGEILYLNVDRPTGIETVYGYCLAPQFCQYEVTCDQFTMGGGWLVIQRKVNNTAGFGRTWAEYKSGFGNQRSGDFWIGNEYLTQLTNNKDYELLVYMLTTTDQVLRYRYNNFRIEPESDRYRLRLGTMTEGLIDELRIARNQQFSTRDLGAQSGCAVAKESGWWWEPLCLSIGSLNQPMYNRPTDLNLNGQNWAGIPLKGVAMMLREQTFIVPPSKQDARCVRMSLLTLVVALMILVTHAFRQ